MNIGDGPAHFVSLWHTVIIHFNNSWALFLQIPLHFISIVKDHNTILTNASSLLLQYLTVTIPVVFMSYVFAYVWSCLMELPFSHIEGSI